MSPFKPVRGGQARKQVLPDISLLATPVLKASSLTPSHAVLPEGTAASSKKRTDLQVSVPPRASFSSFWSSKFSPLPATITCPTAEPGVDISGLLLTDPSSDPHAESSSEQYRLDEGSEIVTSTSSMSGSWQAFPLSVASAPLSSSFSPSSYSPSCLLSPVSATESASPPLSPSRRTTSLHATDPFAVETVCADSTEPRWASERERAEQLELEVSALKAEMAASREEMCMEREEYEAAIDALKASLARMMREHSEELQQLRAALEEASGVKASPAEEALSAEGDKADCEQGGVGTDYEDRDVTGWRGAEAGAAGCEGRASEEDLRMEDDNESKEGGSMEDRETDSAEAGADVGTYKDEEWTIGQGNVEWLQQKLQESQARVAELEKEVMVLGERLLDARKRVTAGMVQMELMSLSSGMAKVQAVPRVDAHVDILDCDDDYDDGSSCDGGEEEEKEVTSATSAAADAPSDACCSLESASSRVDREEEDHACKDVDHAGGVSAHAAVSLDAGAHGSSTLSGSCEAPGVGVNDGPEVSPACEEPASALTDRKVRFREFVQVLGNEAESVDCTERMMLSDEKSWDWMESARARDRQREWWPTGQSMRERRKLTCSDHSNVWQDSETHAGDGYEWDSMYGAEEMLGEQRNGQQWKRREMLLQQMEAQVQCVEEQLGGYCSDIAGQMKVDMQALAQQLLNGMVSWQGWKEKRKAKKSLAADPTETHGQPPCATVSSADGAAAAVGSCDESCTGSGFFPQPLDVLAACVSEVMFEDFECDRFQRAAYCEFASDSERCARNYDKFLVQRWRRGPMNPLREPKFVSFCERKAERVADVLVGAILAISPLPCKQDAGHLPIVTRGLYITPADRGQVLERLKTWPEKKIRVIVVTDGERILGLGDLGYGGMGISEGKILLYTVIAGVDPHQCLPICLDVGTNNESLLADPQYKGLKQHRLRGEEYDALVDELMTAVRAWQPHILLQFEDFGNTNAFRLLDRYRGLQCCFNDDIQGTACITLAGVLSGLRVTRGKLQWQRIVFLGAGEAGTGIGHLIAQAMHKRCGVPLEEAMRNCLFVDSKGLVCKSRTELQHHKLPFAHDIPFQPDLYSVVKAYRPTILIGVSTIAGAFTREIVEAMSEINDRPIIFPLSNPTSKSECTYRDAYNWSGGRVVFASGSPFPHLKTPSGVTMYPAQANNAYIFGPVGMAALLTNCRQITDDLFMAAAEYLADLTPQDNLDVGMLFPSFSAFKSLVVPLVARTAEFIVREGLGVAPKGVKNWEEAVRAAMYHPSGVRSTTPRAAAAIKVPSHPVSEVHWEDMEELVQLREMYTDLQRYLFLRNLQEKNVQAFWQLTMNNAQEILPFVYTPTVGEACQKYSRLPINTRGLFLSPSDKGTILDKLKAWPDQKIRVIVVTDGERILGLGDLGYGGMGISEGKILLYTVIAGVDPHQCLPICLDVGTNNESLLADPQYKGLKQHRLRGEEYDALVDELMTAVRAWQPHILLQFEDFGNTNAFRLLDRYRGLQCCFNDDIQGTACITLAGILSALRVTKGELNQQKILFLGAGEAGTGIGHLIAQAMHKRCGIPLEEALQHCLFVDSKGLVCKSRKELQHHKLPFAHDIPFLSDLLSVVKTHKPTMLIGVSTIAGAFTSEILEAMADLNEHPVIFPLSNPTSKSECTFQDAYHHTHGNVVFASGSPFPAFTTHDKRTLVPAQANNAYVFPPIGMAAVLTNCSAITDGVFLEAAEALASKVPESRLASGMLFPAFSDMKVVSPQLIADIAQYMIKEGLGSVPADFDAARGWLDYVCTRMWHPDSA
ncbi:unnamed protein product [Closterium sp. NIES-65]|nr:unnamed protein product [Closterium sp. NIES-65]